MILYKNYIDDILNKKILVSNKVKKAVDRHLADIKKSESEDYPFIFDESKVEKVITELETYVLSDGKYNGKTLELLAWQQFLIAMLYGWVHKSDSKIRKYKRAFITLGRMNGKTALISALQILHLKYTQKGQIYSLANSKEQASISLGYCKDMVTKTEKLAQSLEVYQYSVFNRKKGGSIKALSTESKRLDGKHGSFVLFDEVAAMPNANLINVMESGMLSESRLSIYITTANFIQDSPGYDYYQYSDKVLKGVIEDKEFFALVYELDKFDSWKDSSKYIKANPSLGSLVELKTLEQKLEVAKNSPSQETEFRTKNLNQWLVGTQGGWIGDDKWSSATKNHEKYKHIITDDLLKTYPCAMGIDLSKRFDFTVFTIAFYIKKINSFYLKHHFYMPHDQIEEKLKKDSQMVLKWIEQGYITATTGNSIDYDLIANDIIKEAELYNPIQIGYDQYMSSTILDKLEPILTMVPIDQRTTTLSEPSKDFEELILKKQIIDANPVMRWNVNNVVVERFNNLIKIKKSNSHSPYRIDGVITSIMALMPLKKLTFQNYSSESEKAKKAISALADFYNN